MPPRERDGPADKQSHQRQPACRAEQGHSQPAWRRSTDEWDDARRSPWPLRCPAAHQTQPGRRTRQQRRRIRLAPSPTESIKQPANKCPDRPGRCCPPGQQQHQTDDQHSGQDDRCHGESHIRADLPSKAAQHRRAGHERQQPAERELRRPGRLPAADGAKWHWNARTCGPPEPAVPRTCSPANLLPHWPAKRFGGDGRHYSFDNGPIDAHQRGPASSSNDSRAKATCRAVPMGRAFSSALKRQLWTKCVAPIDSLRMPRPTKQPGTWASV
jgi:hypothetical protein